MKFFTTIIGIFFLFTLSTQMVFAEKLFWSGETNDISLGQERTFSFLLDSRTYSVNGVEGVLVFPDTVSISSVKDGNSIVNLWVQKPEIVENKISFTGLIPGGFRGNRGILFSVTVKGIKEGIEEITLENGRLLLNDGEGTEIPILYEPLSMNISSSLSSYSPRRGTDTTPPEPFQILLSQNEASFENKWFIAFHTQDKGEGVEKFQIQERLWPLPSSLLWKDAESPTVLRGQKGFYYTWVRALDYSGNEYVSTLPPRVLGDWANQKVITWGILILVFLLIGARSWYRLYIKK